MVARFLLSAVILALVTAARAAPVATPSAGVVQVESGALHGVAGPDAISFKGIPYAAPPVGPLRWEPPQPPTAWSGVREAAAFGAACPQTSSALTAVAGQSEDCLTLNVWRPLNTDVPATVMVWVHGGGDAGGTASQPQYDGSVFARDGIVFVSVDYRLGALGWFAHPALTREAPADQPLGSYGLMDQIAALQWVKRNIAAFGGDPARVTVAGESAGGESVLFLMITPAAKGLFTQAIVESGLGWATYPTLSTAETAGADLAKRAGAAPDADAAALRALPVSALVAAEGGFIGPSVDGRLILSDPAWAFASAAAARVPLLIGSNNGEDNLLGKTDPKALLKDLTPADLAALRAAYGPEASDDDALGRAVFRDQLMGAPARWIAARQSNTAPAFLYQFAYVPQILRARMNTAHHGFEMLFAFEAMARAPRPLVATDTDRAEMSLVHGCWASFVKTGAPACPGGLTWPPYTPDDDRLMRFGEANRPEQHFRKAVYDILDRIKMTALDGR